MLKVLFYIIICGLLTFSFQNCSKQNSHFKLYGGGEVYQGHGKKLISKKYVVNSELCSDGKEAYAITKADYETHFILDISDCEKPSFQIEPQFIEWVADGISFNYDGRFYELKHEIPTL